MTDGIPNAVFGYLVQRGYHLPEIRSMSLLDVMDTYTWLVADEIMRA